MDILIADLHEDRPGLGEQIARDRQPIAQIRQVAMNSVPPRVAKRLHLLRLARDVSALPSFTSRLVVDHWKLLLNLMPYGGSK